MDELVVKLGLEQKIEFSKMKEIWSSVVGEVAARSCIPTKFDKGILNIKTNSSTWRMELFARKEYIINEINSQLGKNIVAGLNIR